MTAGAPTTGAPPPRAQSRFIISARADLGFMVLSPLLSLGLAWLVSLLSKEQDIVTFYDQKASGSAMAVLGLTQAHLVAVLFRSHGNPAVRARHPWAFFAVPVLLTAAMAISPLALAFCMALTVFWDVYHSSMQTFGLCRIYDAKLGAPPLQGRTLDIWMNHAIYVLPILAGPTATLIISTTHTLRGTPLNFIAAAGSWAIAMQPVMVPYLAALGVGIVILYIVLTGRMVTRGYPLSPVKVGLLVSTAVTCVAASGFDAFGQALLVVNVFHAVQYLALVWFLEQKNILQMFGVPSRPGPRRAALLSWLFLVGTYGFVVGVAPKFWREWPHLQTTALIVVTAINLLHFWYDGFIWSVRRQQVAPAPAPGV